LAAGFLFLGKEDVGRKPSASGRLLPPPAVGYRHRGRLPVNLGARHQTSAGRRHVYPFASAVLIRCSPDEHFHASHWIGLSELPRPGTEPR
jgi:hypothetical protein